MRAESHVSTAGRLRQLEFQVAGKLTEHEVWEIDFVVSLSSVVIGKYLVVYAFVSEVSILCTSI